ncbi:hypothetical protein C8R26_101198 [Nitrosomonas oligotropha]|uniref:Uncharacterized protein n=1 Tax=Nitrosomonas oligotropha TaxID=42354 RepID=A0A2T5I4Y0_9PROT|nr:hypothetical protein [Nitrosomonas oligotropha]PTQ78882.1 hypothetical protein C8R26_101198 [Nitrosomonas oligotropha]
MTKNLVRTIISIPIFMLFLLLSMAAMAQSLATPPEIPVEGDRRDTGHQPQPEHIEDYRKSNAQSASDSTKAKPSSPSSADQKNPVGSMRESTKY